MPKNLSQRDAQAGIKISAFATSYCTPVVHASMLRDPESSLLTQRKSSSFDARWRGVAVFGERIEGQFLQGTALDTNETHFYQPSINKASGFDESRRAFAIQEKKTICDGSVVTRGKPKAILREL